MSDYLIPGRFLNYEQENLKAINLEQLYNKLGRNDPNHPMHSLYTGLWDEAREAAIWLNSPYDPQSSFMRRVNAL